MENIFREQIGNKMKIAIAGFAKYPSGGAVSNRLFMMAKGLACLGHEVHFLLPFKYQPGPLAQEHEKVNVTWGEYVRDENANSLLNKIMKRISLYKIVRQQLINKLDWLILYDLGMEGLPFLIMAKRYRCYIASENCDIRIVTYNPIKERIIIIMYKISDMILRPWYQLNFCVTKYLEQIIKKKVPESSVVVVPAIVTVSDFKEDTTKGQQFREKWNLGDNFIISYMGNLAPIHGLEILLEAGQYLIKKYKRVRITISGRNIDENRYEFLQKIINKYKIHNEVVFTGFLSTEEVIAAMSAADILVSPQIDHDANKAGFPQKIAEYLSIGKPVVTSATGDISLYLKNGENALLCKPGDPVSLAMALERLINEADLRKQLSKKSREAACRYFDCIAMAKKIEEAFKRTEVLVK
jgi:glycosyltransferase involved in cell wall biosynthesis